MKVVFLLIRKVVYNFVMKSIFVAGLVYTCI